METKQNKTKWQNAIGFKSYYVVWKLRNITYSNNNKMQFKSYYVVWKPIGVRVTNNTGVPFKSYYVVWKHIVISVSIYAIFFV